MAEVLRGGNTPFLHAFASSAVRLCQVAQEAGVSLKGAKFSLGGEPTTNARMAVIESIGAEGIPVYASIETGAIGTGCFEPEAADDVHMFHDLFAVIHPESNVERIPSKAIFLTSVEKKAPLIMLNFSMGDEAVIKKRKCGCLMQSLGWETHLHSIRSYEKLTTGGLTMLDTDVIRVLEEYLPGRFGGGPTDYQLLEEEFEGQPRLTLLVSPTLGQVDTDKIGEAFLVGIGAGNRGLWRTPGFFSVDRREPKYTVSGKIRHLHAGPHAKSISV
jgi:phenylacetate-coenzyme A ligase PaaK-like adenylate-forming protein